MNETLVVTIQPGKTVSIVIIIKINWQVSVN